MKNKDKDTKFWMIPNKNCWVYIQNLRECYKKVTISKLDEKFLFTKENEKFLIENAYEAEEENNLQGISDMVKMTFLNEPELIHNMKTRLIKK